MGASEIAAEPRDFVQVIGYGYEPGHLLSGSHKMIDQDDFVIGQREPG